jgi:hypothetical protein
MSLAIEEEMQDFLKRHAKANNVSVSKLIRDLVDTYLLQAKKITVVHHDADYVPVVLKVPASLKGDREGILTWLKIRITGIAERLSLATPQETVHEDSEPKPVTDGDHRDAPRRSIEAL